MWIMWENIFKRHDENQNNLKKILRNIPVFQNLSDRELVNIERILYRRNYRPTEVIFREGEPGLGMYIIEKGIVSITLADGEHPLIELSDGDFFGELSLLDNGPRSATATARDDCRLLCFFQPELMQLLTVSPKIGVKILLGLSKTLGERLKRANDYIQILKAVGGDISEQRPINV